MTFNALFGTMKFLSTADKLSYEQMFVNYMNDLPANFYLNQFDLAKKYEGTDYEDWNKFLSHPAFSKWKSQQINTIAAVKVDEALSGNIGSDRTTVNVLQTRQQVLEEQKNETKPTMVVMPMDLFLSED